jgi:hypothetical protein
MKAIIKINGQEEILPASVRTRQDIRNARERGNVVSLSTKEKTYKQFKEELLEVGQEQYTIFFTEDKALSILAKYYPENVKPQTKKIDQSIWSKMVKIGRSPFLAGCRIWDVFTGDLEKDIGIYKEMDSISQCNCTNPESTICTGFVEIHDSPQ